MRILVVEDDPTLQRGLAQALDCAGHTTVVASDGERADLLLTTENFDLLVLDIGLPKMDGLTVLERLRRRRQSLPVLILSARERTHDRVDGLDRGADDYLTKPFELSEFEARVRALLRRGQAGTVRIGGLAWKWETREATIANVAVELTRHEATLLEALIQTPGRTVSKTMLAERLGDGIPVEDNLVEVYMHRLRRKLINAEVSIRTVRGLGYRLNEIVQGSPGDE